MSNIIFIENYITITGLPEPIINNNFKPVLLISGEYNLFNSKIDFRGCYMCSGLYVSESFKLPIYIGGSEIIENRIEKQHIPSLNNNKHDNSIFQNSWNKHNFKDGFVWWFLEESKNEESWKIEQKWLNYYRPFKDEFGGFNIAYNVLKPMLGRKHSDESKIKNSESNKKLYENGYVSCWLGKHHTKESKEKMSKSRPDVKGEKNPMFGGKYAVRGKSNSRFNHTEYKLINKDTNETFKGNQYDFRKKYNLESGKVSLLVNKKKKTYKGWILIE